MQSVSSKIWTHVTVSISYDDNDYTTGTSKSKLIVPKWFRLCYAKALERARESTAKLTHALALRSRANGRGNRLLKLTRDLALIIRANKRGNWQLELTRALAPRSRVNVSSKRARKPRLSSAVS